ncbi:hypothetical protein VP01_4752g1 [Puccinia sorghi]|uniref:Uncharacterized protein n=1 Tax=Puccinia sorghi TaxID=27349 RepID=A0A0L6UMU8_9BASI|nr:hypothetical protein VP01_4752g1 [Puccinia sorghi]
MQAQAPKTEPPLLFPTLSPSPMEACLFRLTKSKVNMLSPTKALKILPFVYFGLPQISAFTMSSETTTSETPSYRLAYISSTTPTKLRLCCSRRERSSASGRLGLTGTERTGREEGEDGILMGGGGVEGGGGEGIEMGEGAAGGNGGGGGSGGGVGGAGAGEETESGVGGGGGGGRARGGGAGSKAWPMQIAPLFIWWRSCSCAFWDQRHVVPSGGLRQGLSAAIPKGSWQRRGGRAGVNRDQIRVWDNKGAFAVGSVTGLFSGLNFLGTRQPSSKLSRLGSRISSLLSSQTSSTFTRPWHFQGSAINHVFSETFQKLFGIVTLSEAENTELYPNKPQNISI